MKKLGMKSFMIVSGIMLFLTCALIICCSSCQTYTPASDTYMKKVICDGTGYYATKETKDSVYLEVIDKWVSKDSCELKNAWNG